MFWRLPLLRTKTRLESLVSREATFLYNNLLLVALCLTILWGVAFPMLSELVRGESRTVGRPYYDFFLRTFGLPLLLLMGIGPLIAWRRASLRSLGRMFFWPAGLRSRVGVVLLALGAGLVDAGPDRVHVLARSCSRRSCSSSCAARARRRLVHRARRRNRRRYGGYIVHAAIVLLALGVAGSSAYGSSAERKLSPGQSMRVARLHAHVPLAVAGARPRTTSPSARPSTSRATASSSRASSRGRTAISPRSRSRTRWRSTPTGCAPRTST